MKYTLLLCLLLLSLPIYGQGLQYDTLTVKKGYIFQNNHRLYLAYQFIYPTGNTTSLKKIREQVMSDFFSYEEFSIASFLDNDSASKDPKDNFPDLRVAREKYESAIIDEIGSLNKVEQDDYSGYNYDEKYSAIRIVNNKVLVYITQNYLYRGGTHGQQPSFATNYDLATGKRIAIGDLFSEDSQSKILEMMKAQYDASSMYLTDYFVILPKGIQFRFNPYEIAPYALGRIDITIKYTEFSHLLRDDAKRYFNR